MTEKPLQNPKPQSKYEVAAAYYAENEACAVLKEQNQTQLNCSLDLHDLPMNGLFISAHKYQSPQCLLF